MSPNSLGRESEAPTSAWEMVEEEKPKPEMVKAEVEEEVSKLADNLGQVVIDEPDFSPDDPKDDPPKEVIPEDQKADDNPPDDQLSSNATPATDTQPPDQSAKLSTDSPPSTKPAIGLSALSPLQALEATEGEAGVQMGPPPVPQSKAAAMKKSGGKRQREFLVRMSDPTSGDDGEAPKIQDFLISSKATSAAKRASSVSAKKRHCPAPDKQRSRSQDRSRSHGRDKDSIITSGPIKPLPLSSTRKKPQQMVPEGDLSAKGPQSWQQERLDFLSKTLSELSACWPSHSMAWVNLHVAGSYYSFERVTHPRQLAACSLRGNSKEPHRWACWSCQIEPEAAAKAGFSPGKSVWYSDIDQMYHWWGVHGKQSHRHWLEEAEKYQVTPAELLNFLCGCDASRWPFPWWPEALSALPREIPQKEGGLNPRLFKAPYWRKETPSTAASEQWHQVPVPKGSRNKPLSPPRPKVVLTQLGWADPIALYSKIAKEELTFLLQPFNSLPEYGEARIKWHQGQCPLTNVTDFLLYIEQHSFFLLFIKLAGSLALSEPEQFTGEQRESVLGQLAVCPSQLRDAFQQDSGDLKVPLQYMDYADWVHGMLEVLDLPVPIMGKTIPRPPASKGVFPPHNPSASSSCPASSTTASASSPTTTTPSTKVS